MLGHFVGYYCELVVDNAQMNTIQLTRVNLFVSCHFRISAGDIGYSDLVPTGLCCLGQQPLIAFRTQSAVYLNIQSKDTFLRVATVVFWKAIIRLQPI